MGTYLLTLNSGSSSLKFALFDETLRCSGRGAITGLGGQPVFSFQSDLLAAAHVPPVLSENCQNTTHATEALITWLEKALPPKALTAIGHRIVHGGDYPSPLRVTADLRQKLGALAPLAPLHQPFNLEAIDLIGALHPDVPQVACFDTSFHATIDPLHRRFGLPRKWFDLGVKRYGFHGLSYEYITGRLQTLSPRAFGGRTIIAHLGSGASLCALKAGKSFDTTMGFSALDGLLMGTRPGTLDPGVLLYFLMHEKLGEKSIEAMLYHQSGLLGVSGMTADMKALLASQESDAREAVDLFCLRIAREVGALVSMMGGLDAMVFTGGIGEHGTAIRAKVALLLGWTGVLLKEPENAAATGQNEVVISSIDSKVELLMIPTDEEIVIARHTREVLAA